MQVFQKQASILGGVDEAIADPQAVRRAPRRRRLGGGWGDSRSAPCTRATRSTPRETGDDDRGRLRALSAHLRPSTWAAWRGARWYAQRQGGVEAAHGKPILFFPARHDHWLGPDRRRLAAHVAGAIGVSTDAQASWWGGVVSAPCRTA
jgi:nicotinate phosphoribosyltransferase